jgi:Mlc titration factor MtfA (ptsG expression regulator)
MIFRWLRRRRRRRLVAQPFPDQWLDILQRNVLHYGALGTGDQARLRDILRIVVAEKHWEGCRGLQIDDEIRVTIAAQIALLVLGLNPEYFDNVQSILVYPDAYIAPGKTITKGGVVLEGESAREGEAWYRGPVVLSWADALAGGRRQSGGDNLVLHEFAHQLDMLNGRVIDGTPVLENRLQYDRWTEVMSRHYRRLVRDCRRGRPTLLDCYGATSIGEFFAVSTEAFFERATAVERRYPDLYAVLRDYYRQDPADRAH